jgi:hypothetical protein
MEGVMPERKMEKEEKTEDESPRCRLKQRCGLTVAARHDRMQKAKGKSKSKQDKPPNSGKAEGD